MRSQVAAVRASSSSYPKNSPYDPSEKFPEYQFGDSISEEANSVYPALRDLFLQLGYDTDNFGSADWNPLGHIVEPGMTVVLKPNFVRSRHYDGKDPYGMITHPSVLRAIADYCWIALKGSGKIVIADAPNFDSDWEELRELTGMDLIESRFREAGGASLEVYDLRDYWGKSRVPFLETRHMPSCERKLKGDPEGNIVVNLGDKSALYGHPNPERFYGAVFDRQETIKHHSGERQEYEVSRTVMNADVVISVPKLKVHKRSGVTLNIKGLVGICTNKNFLVHYILGEPSKGGDQIPDDFLSEKETKVVGFERWMYDTFLSHRSIALEMVHRVVFGVFYLKLAQKLGFKVPKQKRLLEPGNWYGNDSTWRMATDLYKVLCFSDRDGNLTQKKERRMLSIVDGIIGGEKKGPLTPDPKPAGVLIGGENYLAVDIAAARLMGFDPRRIKMYKYLLENDQFDYGLGALEDVEIISDVPQFRDAFMNSDDPVLGFEPYPSWVGHLEVKQQENGNGR